MWEYHVYVWEGEYKATGPNAVAVANRLGNYGMDGWELVSSLLNEGRLTFILKRPRAQV
jgi:hypothetical protein